MKQQKLLSLLMLVILCCPSKLCSQELKTTVVTSFKINTDNKVFNVGDTVSVFAYKKKSDKYYFAIYTESYAKRINISFIPFNLTNKELKKLPDALDERIESVVLEKQKEIEIKLKSDIKKKALAGNYKQYVRNFFYDENDKITKFNNQELTILGISKQKDGYFEKYYFAIDSKDTVGYYYYRDASMFEKLPLVYMPSVDDPDVRNEVNRLNAKYAFEKQQKAENERRLAAIKKVQEDSIQAVKDSIAHEENKKKMEELTEEAKVLIAKYKKFGPAIINVGNWDQDSAGRITVNLSITNCSNQTIKYVTFKGYFTNAVGDKCRNEIGGGFEWKGKGIGPIAPFPKTPDEFFYNDGEHKGSYSFDGSVFYSRIAQYFHLSSVTIEYMNGKKTVLSGPELKKRVIYE